MARGPTLTADRRLERGRYPDDRFLRNVKEARYCGYAFVCAECGCGIQDESDMHDPLCPDYPEDGYDLR